MSQIVVFSQIVVLLAKGDLDNEETLLVMVE